MEQHNNQDENVPRSVTNDEDKASLFDGVNHHSPQKAWNEHSRRRGENGTEGEVAQPSDVDTPAAIQVSARETYPSTPSVTPYTTTLPPQAVSASHSLAEDDKIAASSSSNITPPTTEARDVATGHQGDEEDRVEVNAPPSTSLATAHTTNVTPQAMGAPAAHVAKDGIAKSSASASNVGPQMTDGHTAKRRWSGEEDLLEPKRIRLSDENIDPVLLNMSPEVYDPHFVGPRTPNVAQLAGIAPPPRPVLFLAVPIIAPDLAAGPIPATRNEHHPFMVSNALHLPIIAQGFYGHTLNPFRHQFGPPGAPINYAAFPGLTAHAFAEDPLPAASYPTTRRRNGNQDSDVGNVRFAVPQEADTPVRKLRPPHRPNFEDDANKERQKTIDAHRANCVRKTDDDEIICLWKDIGMEQPCHLSFAGTDALLAHCVKKHGVHSSKASKEMTDCLWADCGQTRIVKGSLKRHLGEYILHGRRARVRPEKATAA